MIEDIIEWAPVFVFISACFCYTIGLKELSILVGLVSILIQLRLMERV